VLRRARRRLVRYHSSCQAPRVLALGFLPLPGMPAVHRSAALRPYLSQLPSHAWQPASPELAAFRNAAFSACLRQTAAVLSFQDRLGPIPLPSLPRAPPRPPQGRGGDALPPPQRRVPLLGRPRRPIPRHDAVRVSAAAAAAAAASPRPEIAVTNASAPRSVAPPPSPYGPTTVRTLACSSKSRSGCRPWARSLTPSPPRDTRHPQAARRHRARQPHVHARPLGGLLPARQGPHLQDAR
jgi:hypothetical protein